MALDHGILNTPLKKRGDIDQQIDAHKREQAAAVAMIRKAQAATLKVLKAKARVALDEIKAAPGLLDRKAAAMNKTAAALLAHLEGWAKWEPANLIKLKAQWLPE